MSCDYSIKLVVFDWAGTTVDHGCFAPVAAFIETFAREGVRVDIAQARGPMGLHKKDHLRAMASQEPVRRQWRDIHGSDWSEEDIERMYRQSFVPLQLECAEKHSGLTPGLLDAVDELRKRGIKIGGTTGYFREAAETVRQAARAFGYAPDCNLSADDVSQGRPAPFMIFRIMESLDVYPPFQVVKVGDTVPDIEEGVNAGVWSVGVTHTSSEVGCTEQELASLPSAERTSRIEAARRKLLSAGADEIIDSVAQTPALIDRLERRLANGERPFAARPS